MAANSLFMKKNPAIKMVAGVFYLLPFLGRYCHQHTECYTEQCREQHPLFGREQEGNGVSRIPEERIVFLNTKPHCACQLMEANRSAIGIGVMSALSEPPLAAMWASVILGIVSK